MNKNVLVMVVLVIIVGAIAFFGGMKYQQSKQPQRGSFMTGQGGQGAQGAANRQRAGAANQNFRPVSGEIISKDDKSITVKQTDGSNRIVIYSQSTEFLKSAAGTVEDLKTGDKVMVVGTSNTDGSVTAQNVQINPPVRNIPTEPGTQNK